MGGSSNSVFGTILNNVFPRVPDFYGMISEQCNLAAEAAEMFVLFMETGSADKAKKIREMKTQANELKVRNLDVLNQAFATPMDRENLYRAIMAIDTLVNYFKTTVREMEVLGLKSDAFTLEIATLLRDGTIAIKNGFSKIQSAPRNAEVDATAAKVADQQIEQCYSRAIAALFTAEQYSKDGNALPVVMEIFKRRELYRHLVTTGDYMASAGNILHDIIVQIA